MLIFDINSEYKLKNILGNNTFVFDSDNVFYTWENEFDEENELCDFYLTFFVKNKNGEYMRVNEEQTQRAYKTEDVEKMLKTAGFKILNKYNGYSSQKVNSKSERIVFECIKTEEK